MKHGIAVILSMLFLAGCQQADTSDEWTRITDGYVEAWNTGNLEILDGVIDAQFVRVLGSTITSEGLDSLKNYIAAFREMYPDLHVTIDEGFNAGDRRASRWTFTATHSGLGNPALEGKPVSVTGMSLDRMADGKMVEERLETNQLPWMLQLGYTLTPPSGADE